MKAGQYIYAKLAATTAVTNLVGTRIYPIYMPQQATYPAIVFSVDNAPLDGNMKDLPAYHDRATVTFNFWADVEQGADGYAALDNIDAAVRTALDFVTGTAGSVVVEGCKYIGSTDGIDPDVMKISRTATYQLITKNG